ncbi:hypothetical protein Misp01_76480 [Microtetraspora sp. NBRC 13810]|nr:hypothetical protein Misp01_76480 [Microtetraspora sp. NBRC 13810]
MRDTVRAHIGCHGEGHTLAGALGDEVGREHLDDRARVGVPGGENGFGLAASLLDERADLAVTGAGDGRVVERAPGGDLLDLRSHVPRIGQTPGHIRYHP